MKNILMLTGVLGLCFIISCSNNKNITGKKISPGNIHTAAVHINKIPPGHCRIVGTIASIDSTLDSYSPRNPCSIHPCNALVRIDSIIGYGSSFPPLQPGREIQIHFYFTLSKVDKVSFPGLKESYPGLNTGSSFEGDISVLRELNETGKQLRFAVYSYQKEIK